jgi:hypothetical protein
MSAFSKPLPLPEHISKVTHRRLGKKNEYVDYHVIGTPIHFRAQRAGGYFVVLEYEQGKRGFLRVVASFLNADSASHQAHDMAMNKADNIL